MDVKKAAAQGGLWFASISLVTQAVSWVFTFYVIRLLNPADYGLMTMASILTAYLQMFAGLGLGSGIVQRREVTDAELDAVFWLSFAVGIALGAVAVALAYPTAWLFHEDRVIPVTRLIGVLFVVSGLSTVPYALLSRRIALKRIAEVNAVAALSSSVLSVVLAQQGYGVYTLIYTNLALNGCKLVLFFVASGWRPRFRYSSAAIRPHLSYGIYIGMSSASLRLFQQLDRLVVGRFFGAVQLGIYGSAMTVSSMALDKIWPLYQQVAFPLFSRLQDQTAECRSAYLSLGRHYLAVMCPIYVGSIVVASDLIGVVLGPKWAAMVPMLRVFCFVKLLEVLTSYQAVLLNAIGHHREVFWFYLALVILVPVGVLLAALHSFDAIMIPWLLLYPVLCVAWLFRGLHKAGIAVIDYARAVMDGLKASMVMGCIVLVAQYVGPLRSMDSGLARLLILVSIGVLTVTATLWGWQRDLVREAIRTVVRRQDG